MMKRLTMAMAILAGLCSVSATADAQGCEPKIGHPPLVRKGHLIASINPTVAPIQYINEDGEIVGLDVDLGNAIAKRLCLTMQFQSTQFATMIPILKEGRIDMINSFMFYTPERAAQVLMVPYGASSYAIIVPKANKDEVKGLEYFSGKPFSVELGTVDYADAKAASEALVKAGKPAIDIRTFGTYADVLQSMAAGQAAGAIIGVEQAVYYKKKGADFFRVAVGGLEPHAEAFAFKEPALAEAVVKVMNEMKADGSFDKIFEPYGHCVLPGPYKVMSGPMTPFTCPQRKD
ncbi:MAG TPA: ABC transporter substrate-binding protein [Reyranella sp.]|nr:ABC transporter substrate-binding protein [Reyranella sp.]